MKSMKEIDSGLKQTEVEARKSYLIRNLKKLGISYTSDGRRLEDVSLYTLEWTNVTVQNNEVRACQQSAE